MAFVSNLAELLLLPSNFIGVTAALGLLGLILRWRRLGRALFVLAALILIIAGRTRRTATLLALTASIADGQQASDLAAHA